MGIQARTWENEARDAEIHIWARCSGKEADESCIHHREIGRCGFVTGCRCAAGIETQQRRGENSLETESRRSEAEVMKKREREMKKT